MPLTPAFTVTQSIYDLDVLTITDTSTGSDAAIAQRRVFLVKDNGAYLTPFNSTTDYIIWPYSSPSISIGGILDRDYSLAVQVEFVSSDNGLIAAAEKVVALTGFGESHLLDLTRLNASHPKRLSSKNYFEHKMKIRCLLDDAVQAAANDEQLSAQVCLNEARTLIKLQVFNY